MHGHDIVVNYSSVCAKELDTRLKIPHLLFLLFLWFSGGPLFLHDWHLCFPILDASGMIIRIISLHSNLQWNLKNTWCGSYNKSKKGICPLSLINQHHFANWIDNLTLISLNLKTMLLVAYSNIKLITLDFSLFSSNTNLKNEWILLVFSLA